MNRPQLTLGQRISGALLLLIALLITVATFSWRGLTGALHEFDEYRHCARSSNAAGKIQAAFFAKRLATKDYLALTTENTANEYRARDAAVMKLLVDARRDITEPDRVALLEAIGKVSSEHSAVFEELLAAVEKGAKGSALDTFRQRLSEIGDASTESLEKLKSSIIARQDEVGPRVHANLVATVNRVLVTGAIAVVVGILSAGLAVFSINQLLKKIANSINEGADQVAATSSQLSAASQTLSEGASEQAAALEETGASIVEIASMTRSNADGTAKAAELSKRTREAAETGASSVDQLARAMQEVKASSYEMAKILKTIDEIAFQTNILALNAAVEAARAGEAGAGFAVVADEVRNLAHRSANSAKETSAKIEDSMQKCENGAKISEDVATTLREILGRAQQVDSVIEEISRASKEQSEGLTQVTTAVSQMDKVTQANASSAEEAAASAEELSSQAAVQKNNVAQLLALVEGNKSKPSHGRRKKAQEPLSHETLNGSLRPRSISFSSVGRASQASRAA